MGDWTMTCPACDGHSSDVGFAYRDHEPCPYCGLAWDVFDAVRKAQERNADEALVERMIAAEVRATEAERARDEAVACLAAIRTALAAADDSIRGGGDGCACGCPADVHVGEIGCPCGLPDEPPCSPMRGADDAPHDA